MILSVDANENYVEDLSKIYLKYDLAKSQRLNGNEEKKLIRRVLESNNLEYSTQKVEGSYSDEISFDYQVGDVCIKILSKNARVLKLDDGMDYILKQCS